MKRRAAFVVGALVLGVFVWLQIRHQDWSKWIASTSTIMAPVVSVPTTTVSGPAFLGDRTKPYAIKLVSGTDLSILTWQLTVADRIQGYAYTANETYDVYGDVSTTTDSFTLTAYQPSGDMKVATATATWRGNQLEGVVSMGTKTMPLHLADITTTTAAQLTFEHADGRWEDARRQMECEFGLTYPVVQATGSVSQAAADRMNREIRSVFLAPIGFSPETYRSGGPQNAEQAKEDFLRACRNELEDAVQGWKEGEDAGSSFHQSQNTSIAIALNRNGILSFTADAYSYSGGAHGLTTRDGFVFDTRTGERLKAEQLIRADQRGVFEQRIAREVLRLYHDELFEETAAQMRTFVNKNASKAQASWVAGQSGLSTSTVFYLIPQGMRVVFQQYEIAPYAVGLPEVILPYARWRDLLIPGRSLAF